MPAILSSNYQFPSSNLGDKKLNSLTVDELEAQLENGSIEAALRLSFLVEINHDGFGNDKDCYQCNKAANYLIIALETLKVNNQPIVCNSVLLQLVQKAIELSQYHNTNFNATWLSILSKELIDVGKKVRDQTAVSDAFVPLPLPSDFKISYDETPISKSSQEAYGRAIRISIYHARAVSNENSDINKSINYYRKCLSVLPSPFDRLELQKSAISNLQRLTASNNFVKPHFTHSKTSSVISSRSSSTSSLLNVMSCANCGLEKKRMPVCSKCKSQSYCSIRCLKTHKPIHDTDCRP